MIVRKHMKLFRKQCRKTDFFSQFFKPLIEQLIYFPDVEMDGPDALEGALRLAEVSTRALGYKSAGKRKAVFAAGAY